MRAAKPNAAKGSPAAQVDTGGARGARPALRDDSPRGRILRAAAHLFHTRGYAQTTVRDLARSVGILSGSIFHHFDSKEAILEAVLREVSARGTERMRSAAGALGPPLARVRALLRCELDSIHGETSEAMTLLASEWRSLGPDAQTRVLRVRDEYEAVWLTALAAARRDLVVVDPFILRRLMQGMTAGSATWYRRAGPVTLDELTEKIMSLIARQSPAKPPSDKHAVDRKGTRAVNRTGTRAVVRKGTRAVGRNDTRAVRRNDTRAVGRNDTRAVGRNDTRAVDRNDTRAVGRNVTRAVGRNVTRAVGRNVTRAVGRNVTRAVGRNDTRAVGRKGEHVMDRRAQRVMNRHARVMDRGGECAVAHKGERVMDRKQEKTK